MGSLSLSESVMADIAGCAALPPSTDWLQGGPIIEREGINLNFMQFDSPNTGQRIFGIRARCVSVQSAPPCSSRLCAAMWRAIWAILLKFLKGRTMAHDLKPQLIQALRSWVAQRPGLEFGNYGDLSAYRAEVRSIGKDLQHARKLIDYVAWHDSITAEMILDAAKSGRLSIKVEW